MSINVRVVGNNVQSDEIVAAYKLKSIIEKTAPKASMGEIVLIANATLLGQEIKDIDLIMIGSIQNCEYMLETPVNDGWEKSLVAIDTFCTVVEIKGHTLDTRFLFSNQDLINQVDGRSFCRNRIILRSCLKTLKKHSSLSEAQKRLFFESLCKLGGITVLDAIPSDSADELCDRTLEMILQQKAIKDGCKVLLQSVSTDKTMKIEVKNGRACFNKTVLISKPETLYRLSIGKELEIAGIKYIITDIT